MGQRGAAGVLDGERVADRVTGARTVVTVDVGDRARGLGQGQAVGRRERRGLLVGGRDRPTGGRHRRGGGRVVDPPPSTSAWVSA